jgi:hypothetical protein
MRRMAPLLGFLSLLAGGVMGCAALSSSRASPEARNESIRSMDQATLEMLFADQVDAITGPPGAIQSVVDGFKLYCISDPENDRMRIIAPIARASSLDPRVLGILLQANFSSTADARYAVSDDIVFATFLHPLSSLSPDLVRSATSQVISLATTFGTTFSAGVGTAPTPP